MNLHSKADDFLMHYGMHPDCVDFDGFRSAFIEEMSAGLGNKQSSLKMLPAYLSADGQPRDGETAIAVDIGGTRLRTAWTRFNNGRFEICDLRVSPVPGSSGEVTKEAFFGEIADRLKPVIDKSSRIGVCFSHAADIMPNGDGRLLSFSKEIKVTGSEGMFITKELSQKLTENGCRDTKSYVLLNDSAAVLLSGAAQRVSREYDSYIGFVLGTGMNISYIEKTEEIKKPLGDYRKSSLIVNTESGDFSGTIMGALDAELNALTAFPEAQLLEKKTAGRYLGQLILLTLKKAAADGLLSSAAGASVFLLRDLSLTEINTFLPDTHGRNLLSEICRDEDDRRVFAAVIERLYERSAKLSAATVAAVIEKTDTGRSPDRPVCVVAEGSTFHKLYTFREKFEFFLQSQFLNKQKRCCRVISVENAAILGTSLAAALNDSKTSVFFRHGL